MPRDDDTHPPEGPATVTAPHASDLAGRSVDPFLSPPFGAEPGIRSRLPRRVAGASVHEDTAAQLASIVRSSIDAIFSTDLDGNIATWNPAAAELFGYDAADIIGRSVRNLVPEDSVPELDEVLVMVRAGERVSNSETVGLRSDGVVLGLSATMSPVRDVAGRVIGTSTIARDTSERLELQRRVEAERRRLVDAQASAGLGSFEIDLFAETFHRSEEFWRIIGRSPSDAAGPDFSFVHPDDLPEVTDALQQVVEGQNVVECTHRVVRPDGEIRWVVTRTSRFRDPSDLVIAGTMLDITERKEAELALEHLAYHDPLTGLANRSKLGDLLDAQLASSHAAGCRVVVALIDIDQFKVINDSLGHSGGDRVLEAIARRLEGALRPGELLARFGGDAFAVVRGGVEGLAEGAELGARLLASLDEPVVVDTRAFHLSMSVGVALSAPGERAEAMFRDADTAMYHAKDRGRARVELFDDALQQASRRRLELRTALATALDRDELSIHYQPVIDLGTSRTSGFEALLRWTHPTFGTVGPGEFIPIAEETGLIVPIGEWVLDRALAQLAEWRRSVGDGDGPWMAVNLSARQMERPDLVARVEAALAASGVPAAALHLELTESVLMDRIAASVDTVHELHRLGIRLSIDDFGTGYSSLSYLKRLPIDILKIDKSFVDGLGSEEDDTSIVHAIIEMARTLGLEVVAEGVETPTQLRCLQDLGCSHGQGYLWDRGRPAEHAAAWVGR